MENLTSGLSAAPLLPPSMATASNGDTSRKNEATCQDDSERSGELFIRAINTDNHQDADHLVELFRAHYGGSYPYTQVYHPEFWSAPAGDTPAANNDAEVERELVSLVVVDRDEYIAHLAIRFDKADPKRAEILFPAVRPDYRKQLVAVSRLLWDAVNRVAAKQGIRVLYHYCLTAQPLSQLIASRCFNAKGISLIPSAFDRTKSTTLQIRRPADRTDVVVMYHVREPQSDRERRLFPPVHHVEQLEKMFGALGLPRTFAAPPSSTGSKAETPPVASSLAVQIEKGIRRLPDHSALGLIEYQIAPSALHSPAAFAAVHALTADRLPTTTDAENEQVVLHVRLDDPACPKFCEQLETYGYQFCGVLPLAANCDCISYTRYQESDLREMNVYGAQARTLYDYLVRIAKQNPLPLVAN